VQDIAALIGNGLSIAYSPNLSIPRITDAIVQRLSEAGADGTDQAQMMRMVAERAGRRNAQSNFEDLVSPFDEFRDTLKLIAQLSDLAGEGGLSIRRALQDSAEFANQLYRHGVSHVLSVIAAESRAREDDLAPLRDFVEEAIQSADGGEIMFGNLNYDTLLMAAICRGHNNDLCDLADGRFNAAFHHITDEHFAYGRPLRTHGNLPYGRRITLVHLHGSLGWLRNPNDHQFYRMDIECLRQMDYWTLWRQGRTDWSPVVVLTNQTGKTQLIQEHPFSLAYEIFRQRLLTANKWLIAGTSMQDEGVCAMLRAAWSGRSTLPQVLVITRGTNPTERQLLDALGWDPVWRGDPPTQKWLHICRDGILAAPQSLEWAFWQIGTEVERSTTAASAGRAG
jgi:SIR2-like domain